MLYCEYWPLVVVLQRIDDIQVMSDKRVDSLKRISAKTLRPVQTVTPEPAIPILQPQLSSPNIKSTKVFQKSKTLSKIEVPKESWQLMPSQEVQSFPDVDNQDIEVLKTKRGHVLSELVDTERVYVAELGSILKV
ncbi:unnamed protein product [Timema podura]|uniref:Uncharacterized protein n=1 Tax=Timema podura TaxID=61482 RepID=A0ABN7P2Y7_TIMPD|nr:unnamed protein product [Timema podura]